MNLSDVMLPACVRLYLTINSPLALATQADSAVTALRATREKMVIAWILMNVLKNWMIATPSFRVSVSIDAINIIVDAATA